MCSMLECGLSRWLSYDADRRCANGSRSIAGRDRDCLSKSDPFAGKSGLALMQLLGYSGAPHKLEESL